MDASFITVPSRTSAAYVLIHRTGVEVPLPSGREVVLVAE